MAYYIKAYVLRDNFLESVNHYLIGSYVGRSCGNSVIHLKQMQSIFNNLGKVASRYNEYDLAIHFFEEGLSYAYQLNDTSKILQELYQIGLTHYHKGNYHQTLFMLDLAKPYQRKSSWKRTQSEITIANALHNLDKLDEALEIEKALILKLNSDTTHNRRQAYFGILYNNIGNIFRDKSEIDSAIFYYKKAILFKKSLVGTKLNYGFLMGSISSLSELYLENKEYVNARRVLLKGVKYIEGGDDQNLANNKYNLEVYQQLVQLYKALEKKDSVVFFKEKYRNQLNRYTDFSKKRNVQFLVDKFNAEREREELDARNEVYLFWFLAMVFAICFLGIIIFFFHRKKSKRVIEMTEHDKRLAELKALKAQVNPHFLFNSLNSIYSFILEEDGEHAEEYLLKYGKLMRKILDHSNLLTVPLNDELETLRLYVDLERLR
ncbi:MAG: histidine kinase, partial [Ekhidna sp.]